MNPARILTVCMAAMLAGGSAALAADPAAGKNAPAPGIAAKVQALTGAETRIVWLRHKQWGGRVTDTVDGGAGFSIMAFDTDGKRERELVPEGEFHNPLISPSGRRVIYSAKTDGKLRIHCVDWNGANSRILSDGFALWPWRDPATGIEWVYASNERYGAFVERFQIDKPEVKERLYTGPVSCRFAVSADGTRAAGEFSWPNAGMLYFRTGQVDRKNYRNGCNTYIAPDNSYMVTGMTGSHELVTLYKPDGSSRDISVVPPGLKPLKDGGRGVMWNPKWASDARHMVVAGPFRNLGPDRADIWLGQFAADFNSIAKWVQVTDNDFMDVYAYAWIETGLGQFGGEAPYVVEVSADRLGGEWEISYGDGTTERTTAIRHTYTKAGRFALVARQGKRELKGTVDVRPQKPPKVTGALLLDDTHVLVTFDEPVQAPSGKVELSPQTAAKSFQLSDDGTELVAEFSAPLPKTGAAIKLQGFADLAQTPNPLTRNKRPVARPKWPGRLTGVACLWQGAKGVNRCYHEAKKTFVKTSIAIAAGRLDRNGALVLSGGAAVDAETVANIGQTVRAAKAINLELVLHPAEPKLPAASGLLPILVLRGPDELGFVVGQKEDKLVLRAKTVEGGTQEFTLGVPSTRHASQVVISYTPGKLFAQLDDKKAVESETLNGSPLPDDAARGYAELLLGTPAAAGQPAWKGKIEALAVHGRALDKEELSRDRLAMAGILSGRKTPPQIEVQATLIGKSKIPDPREIAPYRNALIVNEYRVKKVLKGRYAQKTIRVAQWGMLDLKATPLAAQEPGTSVKLVLETFADHDELVPELISDTLKENFDLTLYTDVNL